MHFEPVANFLYLSFCCFYIVNNLNVLAGGDFLKSKTTSTTDFFLYKIADIKVKKVEK